MQQLEDGNTKLKLPDGSLLMADGTVIKPHQATQTAVTIGREIQSGRAAARTLKRVHRQLGDLPEGDTKQLNAIAAILMYTGVGLSDDDIAVTLGTTSDVVGRIRELDAYRQLSEMFDSAVFDDAKRTAAHILANASASAADRMVGFMESPNEQVALVAAREVLKTNGISTEHATGEKKSGLNIKIVRKGEKKDETITVELQHAS